MKKRLFSMILVLSLLFSMSVPTLAATSNLTVPNLDSSNAALIEQKYGEAGELMKALGIMVGYTDGQLHLERNITRAEYVTTLIRTLNYDFMLGAAVNKFTDVPDNHWAKDYIALANALGYVQGVGDNKFNPDANVTIVEAEAVLLRIMGYGAQADKLGWPNGYTVYAAQTGMTENINIYNSTVATRGHIAQLISNSLEIPFWSYFNDSNKNILTEYMDYKKVTGTITETALTNDELEFNEVKVDKVVYELSDTMAPSYLGDTITGYKDKDGKVAFITVDSSKNVMGHIDSITSKKVEIDDKYYTFASGVDVFVNNKSSYVSRLNPGDLVKILVDKNGNVSAIYAYTFQKENVLVSDITEKHLKVKGYAVSDTQYSIKDKRVLVYKNGQFGDISLLAKDDMVSISSNSNGLFVMAVESKTETGILNSVSSKGVKIGDNTIKLDNSVTYSIDNNKTVKKVNTITDLSALLGLEVVAVLNQEGNVIHIYSKAANIVTGLVIDTYSKNGDKFVEVFDFSKEDYETYEYTTTTNKNNSLAFNEIKALDNGYIYMVEIIHKDNAINTIKAIPTTDELTVTNIYNSSIRTNEGNFYVSDSTVVVKVEDSNDVSIVNWDDISGSSVNTGVKVVLGLEDRSIFAEYVFITDGYEYIGNDIKYGIVESIGRSVYGDFYELYTPEGYETITLKGDAPAGIMFGDIISYRINTDEFAVDVKELHTKYDEIVYIIDDEYVELKKVGDFLTINENVMVFNALASGDFEDTMIDVRDLENGMPIEYIVDNHGEIIFIAVVEKQIPSTLLTDIGSKTIEVGKPVEFTFTSIANDDIAKLVFSEMAFSNVNAIEKLEYYNTNTDTWQVLANNKFNNSSAFLFANSSAKYRVTFKTAGTYSFEAAVTEILTEETLSSVKVTFTVKPAPTHTVTFVGGEGATGTAPTQAPVTVGTQITLPANTFAKEGYTFSKWSDGTGEFAPGVKYTVNGNTTFTAVWTAIPAVKHTVSFKGGVGATGTAPVQDAVEVGSKITLPENTFVKEGYTFSKWSDGDAEYAAGTEYTVNANTVFTAVWTLNPPVTFSVTFAGGDGATGTAPTQSPVEADTVITLPVNTFTKEGYTFAKWSDGTDEYEAGAEYTVTGNVEFTATWTENAPVTFTVDFVGGEGATGTAPVQAPVVEGANITLPANTFAKEGYTFSKWSDGTNEYEAGAEYAVSADTVFTAVWTENAPVTFAITFVGGEGTTGVAPTLEPVTANTIVTLPANTFAKEGHTFSKWSDGVNEYAAGAEYTVSADVEFVAVWTVNAPATRNVTFAGGDGATGEAPVQAPVADGTNITLPANTFTKEGYTFSKWSDGTNEYEAGAEYAVSADTVFTAVWTENAVAPIEPAPEA